MSLLRLLWGGVKIHSENPCFFLHVFCLQLLLKEKEKAQVQNLRNLRQLSFKVEVALEALKEKKTSPEVASECQLHLSRIRICKASGKKGLLELFKG
jgi:hypothetical protein